MEEDKKYAWASKWFYDILRVFVAALALKLAQSLPITALRRDDGGKETCVVQAEYHTFEGEAHFNALTAHGFTPYSRNYIRGTGIMRKKVACDEYGNPELTFIPELL